MARLCWSPRTGRVRRPCHETRARLLEDVLACSPGLLLRHMRVGESKPGGQVSRSWSGDCRGPVHQPPRGHHPGTGLQGVSVPVRGALAASFPRAGRQLPTDQGARRPPFARSSPSRSGWMTCTGPASPLNRVQSGGLGAWSDDRPISQPPGRGLPSHHPLQLPALSWSRPRLPSQPGPLAFLLLSTLGLPAQRGPGHTCSLVCLMSPPSPGSTEGQGTVACVGV